MTLLQTWSALLEERKNGAHKLVGGEVEHVEFPEGVFRGPIEAITIEGDVLTIVNEWTARAPINPSGLPVGGWEKVTRPGGNVARYSIADGILSPPHDIGNGRIAFTYAFGRVTIYPQNGSKLDPARVSGL